jgi:hypothetical protein
MDLLSFYMYILNSFMDFDKLHICQLQYLGIITFMFHLLIHFKDNFKRTWTYQSFERFECDFIYDISMSIIYIWSTSFL